ncbi:MULTISPECIES: nitrilase-related carbon-nitrogen hydrolase [Citrifermentans]|uniref:Nitrilase/amidohydrolase superfamily protein, class 8 n=1 Tax=Citrifermentans bemidjiense (strain ATCC BAA-1014 / DSM 16622 / JCM 12645 / Bem) TaxID=404380 RepID=B5EBC3_CITBB|nr:MULTISPECIES: nitrilase-related carbon-nitrogen hydrolase [Citrifermentans]ACH40415.1 nitrilase/amidohydrolase superfamily protein, class 8 [Citrifermentans bemidjiense Bem]
MDFTVALAQIKPKLGCLDDNLALVEAAIEKGIAAGADLIVFPELALTGYFLKDLVPEVALRLDAPQIEKLKTLSKRISIAIGLVEVSSDFRFFNSALYLEEGEIRHVHRKVYLPTYGLFDEQRYMARGERFRAFDTRFGRVGMLICEDMWHLSAPYVLAMDGAMTLLCLSSSPGRGVSGTEGLGSAAAWQKLTATTAMFLNCRVFYCNRVGYEDGINFWGGSEAISPSGEVTARGAILEEDLVLAKVDGGALRRERIFSPMMRDENLAITVKELKRIDREKEY